MDLIPDWAMQMREKSQVLKTRLDHFPNWMKRSINAYLIKNGVKKDSSHYPWILNSIGGIELDHWGTCDGGTVFVNEPYFCQMYGHQKIAELLGLHLTVIPQEKSFWFPNRTFRYELRYSDASFF
jgi:hypothetical protein